MSREAVYCANVASVFPGMTRAQIMALPVVHGYQAEAIHWERSGIYFARQRLRLGREAIEGTLASVIA